MSLGPHTPLTGTTGTQEVVFKPKQLWMLDDKNQMLNKEKIKDYK